MSELGKAYVQIIPSAKGIQGAITESLGKESVNAGRASGSSISSAIKNAIIGAGIGKALISTLTEGAKLEQSLGGIETLFKDNANTIKNYATNAYKTCGISANSYMENVTGFSASLLQSLGGDTAKAAEIANMAMVDMADNSNKMGTSMESIQYAYQGFAKQNYTMLDNLKLGYGGTKSEMERLLKDAEKLTGVHYDISNLSDVYSAIHAIQGELGITGTTAKEASETLSGSFNSMKASFLNVLGALTTGGDVSAAFENLKETIITFVGGNLIPAIKNVLSGVWQILVDSLNEFIPGLGDSLNALLEFITTLVNDIITTIQEIFSSDFMQGLVTGLLTAFTEIGQAIAVFIGFLLQLNEQFNFLTPLIAGIVAGFVAFKTSLMISSLINSVTTAFAAFNAVLLANPIGMICVAIGLLVAAGVMLYKNWDTIKAFASNLWSHITNVFNNIKTAILNVWNSIVSYLTNVVNNIKASMISAWENIKSAVSNAVNFVKNFIVNGFNAVKTSITNVWNNVKSFTSTAWETIKTTVSNAINAVKTTISNIVSSMFSIGADLIRGLWNGISSVVDWIKSKISGFCSGIVSSMKSFFGIHSPSKVFAEIGEYLDLGLAEGITDNTKSAINAVKVLSNDILDNFDGDLTTTFNADDINAKKIVSGQNVSSNKDSAVVELLNLILKELKNDDVSEKILKALENTSFKVDDREFARLVRSI